MIIEIGGNLKNALMSIGGLPFAWYGARFLFVLALGMVGWNGKGKLP